MKVNITAVIDGMLGSCGKGKVIGQFALQNNAEVAIANCMPNAGHTFSHDGQKRVFHTIPVSAINPHTQLFIGAGALIDLDKLAEEYNEHSDLLAGREIIVHPRVALIEERHKETERKKIKSGSTFSGCGAAQAEKAMRDPRLKFFKGFENLRVSENYHELLHFALEQANYTILEGSQGADLDIDHSPDYPHVTSKQVSVARMCADTGISPRRLKEITMVIRPFPIRISNDTNHGTNCYSGNAGDSEEFTWEQISLAAAYGCQPSMLTKEDVDQSLVVPDIPEHELTTVTKRLRRVFDLDLPALKASVQRNTPDNIYLNFLQYLDQGLEDQKDNPSPQINRYIREYLNYLEIQLGVNIRYLGTGADLNSYLTRTR